LGKPTVIEESNTPTILFKDDFSDPSSGWADIDDADSVTGYSNDSYRIMVKLTDWYFWSTPGKNFSDVIIEVDATKIGGPDENEFGVICRYKDDNNFYILSIGSDGYYGVSKFLEGEWFLVGMDQLLYNDNVINTGNTINHLKVTCKDENLTLEVNGEILVDVKDSSFPDGDVGLIASSFDEPGVDILFDNFIVSRP